MAPEHAKVLVGAALAALAPDNIFDALNPDDGKLGFRFDTITYTEKRFVTLEVIATESPDPKTCEEYKNSGLDGKNIKAAPLGKLTCKYWPMPNSDEYDVPASLRPQHDTDAIYTFWLEDDILADCFDGMKITANICKLDVKDETMRVEGGGVWVMDSVSRIYCSFYTWMANDLARTKFKTVEWNEEEALMGCKHSEATKAREVLWQMNLEKKKAEKEAKAAV